MIRSSALVLMAALVAMNAGLCVCNPGPEPKGHCGAASKGAQPHENPQKSGSCHSHSKPSSGKPTPPQSCCCDGKAETLLSDPAPWIVATDAGSLAVPLTLPELVIAVPILTPHAAGSDSDPPRPSAVPLHLRIHRLTI